MDPNRPTRRRPSGRLLMFAAMAIALSACGAGGQSTGDGVATAPSGSPDNTVSQTTTGVEKAASAAAPSPVKAAVTPTASTANTQGRLLASNCFQCHGTEGNGGFESIRGQDAREVLEFMSKPAGSSIMAAHAQGYTRAQLQTIIAYLQR